MARRVWSKRSATGGLKRAQPRRRGPLRLERLENRMLLATLVVNTRFDVPIDPLDGIMSLREAITSANDESAYPGHDVIRFDEDLSSNTILLGIEGFDSVSGAAQPAGDAFTELIISSDLTIDASAAGVIRIGREFGASDSQNLETSQLQHRVLKILSGNVSLDSVAIQRGYLFGSDGGSGSPYGAGIYNAGNLTLLNSFVGGNIQENSSDVSGGGGGIYNHAGATLSLSNTVVGAVELDEDLIAQVGVDPATLETSSGGLRPFVPGNQSDGSGGGIFNLGRIGDPSNPDLVGIAESSAIRGNKTQGGIGAGIYNGGVLEVSNSEIVGNSNRYIRGLGGESVADLAFVANDPSLDLFVPFGEIADGNERSRLPKTTTAIAADDSPPLIANALESDSGRDVVFQEITYDGIRQQGMESEFDGVEADLSLESVDAVFGQLKSTDIN